MSLNITGKGTIFQVEIKQNFVQANLSTGKKNADGTWTNFNWNVRFVGKSKEAAGKLQDKDRIEITNGIIENTYNKETKKSYVNVVVFDFSKSQSEQKKAEESTTGFVPVEDRDDLPF